MRRSYLPFLLLLLGGCAAPVKPLTLKPASHASIMAGCPAYQVYVDENTLAKPSPSPKELLLWGQDIQRQVEAGKCESDAAAAANGPAQAEGQALQADKQSFKADVTSWQKDADAYNARSSAFEKQCFGKLTMDNWDSCHKEQAALEQMQQDLGKQRATFDQRQQALNAKVADFNARMKARDSSDALTSKDYESALVRRGIWVKWVQRWATDPRYAEDARKAGCPDMSAEITQASQFGPLADAALACLPKVVGQ